MARKHVGFKKTNKSVGGIAKAVKAAKTVKSGQIAVASKLRVKTGVPGVDELLDGGIPGSSAILLTGSCGSGKSIFCLQSLVYGAQCGEPGLYITFEEEPESLKETARDFGWDIDELEKKGLLKIIFLDPYEIKDFSKSLSGEVYYLLKDMKAKRIAVDSVTYLGTTLASVYEIRKTLATLIKRLKELGATTFLISEIPEGELGIGRYGMEEFVVDGVINMRNFLIKDMRQRAIEVLKMRRTNHDNFMHPFKITRKGIIVYPDEQVFKD